MNVSERVTSVNVSERVTSVNVSKQTWIGTILRKDTSRLPFELRSRSIYYCLLCTCIRCLDVYITLSV